MSFLKFLSNDVGTMHLSFVLHFCSPNPKIVSFLCQCSLLLASPTYLVSLSCDAGVLFTSLAWFNGISGMYRVLTQFSLLNKFKWVLNLRIIVFILNLISFVCCFISYMYCILWVLANFHCLVVSILFEIIYCYLYGLIVSIYVSRWLWIIPSTSHLVIHCNLSIFRYTDRKKSAVHHFKQALSLDPLLWAAYEELCLLGLYK